MSQALLEVAVRSPRDVAGADEGGADRLHLVGDPVGGGHRSPEPQLVSAVCRESDVPVHCLLRLHDSWTTTGGELARMVGLAEDFLACGAEGVSFGFLTDGLEVDTELCLELAGRIPGVPWTFPEAFDLTLDLERSWARVVGLPGLVGVRSAGSPQGLDVGYDDLLATLDRFPAVAPLVTAGAGLRPEQVPWLVHAGVRSFHLGPQARPGEGAKADVDAAHVRSWRLLLDHATGREGGTAAG